ncbi:helix-turn-helix domain-containing protein [Gulosibacter hominis]|uniref:helix-turn-helix domain-containing protein n=1 Tax=Gulosibacter hominis TaxID=2770504 RepID=UPI00191AB392|nr:helix-turn-helix domain-containing protein [Gulosibacter hominis]
MIRARSLSIRQAAEYLGVSRSQMYRLVALGRVPAVDLSTGHSRSYLRIPVAALDKLMATDPDDVEVA